MRDFTDGTTIAPIENDPDLGDFNPADFEEAPVSDLDEIAAELATSDEPDEAEIKVEGRPGWSVVYRTDFTLKDVEALKSKCKDKAFARSGGIDPGKHAALLLGSMCKVIRRNGADAELGGQPVTFANKEFQRLLGCIPGEGVVAAVRRLHGMKEGRVVATSDKLMEQAGWADEAVLADPTE